MSTTIGLPAYYYQNFDADFALDIPEEGFGGWQHSEIEIAVDRTAVAVMHAWDCGEQEQFPGWHRAVPYIPRAAEIAWRVFPNLLMAVRRSPLPLFHVVGGGEYYKGLRGYQKTQERAGPASDVEKIPTDPVRDRLLAFKREHGYPGKDNVEDIERGFARIDFAPEARPLDNEAIAHDTHQLFALCKAHGVNHLIYAGFAVDACLLTSPGGMVDMHRHGVLCSVIRDATTAVEIRETARSELAKELGLWRVSVQFGYVFESRDLINALNAIKE